MPVGAGAITPTVKYAQTEPGEDGQADRSKVNTSGFRPGPASQVKDDQTGVKYSEEMIKKCKHAKK